MRIILLPLFVHLFFSIQAQYVVPFQESEGILWGLKKGDEIILEPTFHFIEPFHEGMAEVKMNSKKGFINKKGKIIVPIKYDDVDNFNKGIAWVRINKKKGIIDKTGKELTAIKYYQYKINDGEFHEGLAAVCERTTHSPTRRIGGIPSAKTVHQSLFGFIDRTGKEVIPFQYEQVRDFHHGTAMVSINKKWGYINKENKKISEIKYDDGQSFEGDLAIVQLKDKFGLINRKGKLIIPIIYDFIENSGDGYVVAYLMKEGYRNNPYYQHSIWKSQHRPTCFLFDGSGKKITENTYEYAGLFQDDLAIVSKGFKYGIINKKGEMVVPLQYDYIRGGNENGIYIYDKFDRCIPEDPVSKPRSGLTYSQQRGIDFQSFMMDYALKEPFQEGFARVCKVDTFMKVNPLMKELALITDESPIQKWGFINKKGEVTIPIQYEEAVSFQDGLARVKLNEKWGVIDTFGNTIIPINYFFIDSFIDGIAAVYINKSPNILYPILESGKINKDGVLVESFKPYRITTYYDFSLGKEMIYEIQNKDDSGISDYPIDFEDGIAFISRKKKNKNKLGIINTHKNIIIPIKYHDISRTFNDGMVNVKKNNKFGFFDIKKKRLVIPLEYDDYSSFDEGLAPVKKDDKWGYIDKNNKVIIPFIYDKAGAFKNGVAEVWGIVKNHERGRSRIFYINKKGEVVENK